MKLKTSYELSFLKNIYLFSLKKYSFSKKKSWTTGINMSTLPTAGNQSLGIYKYTNSKGKINTFSGKQNMRQSYNGK